MSTDCPPRSPQRLIELSRALGVPWAVWSEELLGQRVALLCVGGEVLPLGSEAEGAQQATSSSAVRLDTFRTHESSAELLSDLLPNTLYAWRFDPLRPSPAQRTSPWAAWGERGWRWRPALSARYPLPWSEAPSEDEVAAWLQEQDSDGACAWSEQGEELWRWAGQVPEPLSLKRAAAQAPLSEGEEPWGEGEGRGSWCQRVAEVAQHCQSGGALQKVVLARRVSWEAPAGHEWDPLASWGACLSEAGAESCAFVLSVGPEEALVGLTPERLISVRERRFKTHALAGTQAIRGEASIPELERALLSSKKDLREHQLVVDELLARLAPLSISQAPLSCRVKRLRTLLHLETPIEGELSPALNPLQLIQALHPTPALGGAPRAEALEHLRSSEPLERGGYASPWAWMNAQGDLSAHVVIRSAHLSSGQAQLYAGAGVVASSDPSAEWRETEDKLRAIARQLRACPALPQEELNLLASVGLLRGLSGSQGLVGAVVSPGSRSTPLALAADALLETRVVVDERMAGFYALGWARSAGRPVALICTSGSAGAHYLPALIEARYAGVPLIALTADRPESLLGMGAPQTIDQRSLFGVHVKGAWPLKAPRSGLDPLRWEYAGRAALERSTGHPLGPVHLNLPFEEPLWSEALEGPLEAMRQSMKQSMRRVTSSERGAKGPSASPLVRVTRSAKAELEVPRGLLSVTRGLIYCGPLTAQAAEALAPSLLDLSERLGWPIWAEASSQLRGFDELKPRLVSWAERAARQGALPAPSELDGLLLIGGPPHSRALNQWLKAWGERVRSLERSQSEPHVMAERGWRRPLSTARCVALGERPEPPNPLGLPCAWVQGRPDEALSAWRLWLERAPLNGELERAEWRARWAQRDALDDPHSGEVRLAERGRLWGGSIGAQLSRALEWWQLTTRREGQAPPELHVASSTAFRDLDMSLSPQVQARVTSQRGANGIEGTLAATLGALQVTPTDAPALLWLGDLAAHHDLASLFAWGSDPVHARREAPSVILLVNNGGGGIFALLPIRAASKFEELFLTPISDRQKITWEALASHAGFTYERHETNEGLMGALQRALRAEPYSAELMTVKPHLIELIVEPSFDLEQRRSYWRPLPSPEQTR